jgi:nucleotide-binding universal stress UspA family protein
LRWRNAFAKRRPEHGQQAARATDDLRGNSMNILIPVDDSEPALRAIEWVAQLQLNAGVQQVTLLNARHLPEEYGGLSVLKHDAVERALREGQQRVLANALEHAQRSGLKKVAIHPAHGLPSEQIVEVAKAKGVDQIVMGTHGRGVVGTFFLGSVAQQVVHLAPMPVTLVK